MVDLMFVGIASSMYVPIVNVLSNWQAYPLVIAKQSQTLQSGYANASALFAIATLRSQ